MPTPSRASTMAHEIRDAVHALKAPPCRLSMAGTAALRKLESIAQSLEDGDVPAIRAPQHVSQSCEADTGIIMSDGTIRTAGDASSEPWVCSVCGVTRIWGYIPSLDCGRAISARTFVCETQECPGYMVPSTPAPLERAG